jgi:HPr kinase/phosphorylase
MHASCVAVSGRGLLIIGPSGSGKSALALHLLALGAELVADDQTELTLQDNSVIARCPPALLGLIEARGVGILTAPALAETPITLVADLSQPEPDRLPPYRKTLILGQEVDLVLAQGNPHFPSSVLRYLMGSRQA